jgi:hypothetical protein
MRAEALGLGTLMIAAFGTRYQGRRSRSRAMRGDRAQGKMVDIAFSFIRGSPRRPVIAFYTPAGQWVEFTGDVAVEKGDMGCEFEVAYDPASPWRTAVVVKSESRAEAAFERIWDLMLVAAGIALIAYGIVGT